MSVANNFFKTPFGGSQGAPDTFSSGGGSLMGLNNHGSLMNNMGSGFEGPPREANGAFTPGRSFSLGGPAMNNPTHGQSPIASRSRNNRSVSPRARLLQVGATGPTNPFKNPNDSSASQPNLGVYACPIVTQTLKNFEALSLQAGLDPVSHVLAMKQAEVFGENNRHLGQAIMHGQIMMEVTKLQSQVASLAEQLATVTQIVKDLASAPASNTIEPNTTNHSDGEGQWDASPQLLDVMNLLALKLMASPQLSAYTTIKNQAEGALPNSLFNLTIGRQPAGFLERHLSAVHQGVKEASAAKRYYSAIKEVAKHTREKVHVVTGEEVEFTVLTIRSMVQKVSVRCGTVGSNPHVDVVWAATDSLTRAQIAYLRCEAARVLITGGKGSQSIWACVDRKLSSMHLRNNEAYAIARLPVF
ncbi:uncharacterized protein MELLADRAFT_90446 [Melampsora larici-populina 98AG31]|uniref:Uncharacterized protein n=1 Tax=Melampsora larici-populina (strain 98AG31 / pathotype 3-4-7) TaxID=747676 RepID=F4RWZ1_MELLP|nr:uncharacterized protein MELLADRAFT_90446 [Melampsora larici-populina 98AG31]EGG03137.1 hypothetical protein MELLADRAFT_90446 [Melampsora larici-populina 98AG31]